MSVISIILLIFFVLVSFITVFIISIQSEDSTGLGGVFGGGSDTAFGGQSNKTINKLTAILIGLFMFITILYAAVNKPRNEDLSKYVTPTTENTESIEETNGDSVVTDETNVNIVENLEPSNDEVN